MPSMFWHFKRLDVQGTNHQKNLLNDGRVKKRIWCLLICSNYAILQRKKMLMPQQKKNAVEVIHANISLALGSEHSYNAYSYNRRKKTSIHGLGNQLVKNRMITIVWYIKLGRNNDNNNVISHKIYLFFDILDISTDNNVNSKSSTIVIIGLVVGGMAVSVIGGIFYLLVIERKNCTRGKNRNKGTPKMILDWEM